MGTPNDQGGPATFSGQVAYIVAYDVAYDMKREPIGELLGQPALPFEAGPSKPAPPFSFFLRPQTIKLPAIEQQSSLGPIQLLPTIKLFAVGAISFSVRVAFENKTLNDLSAYHELKFDTGELAVEIRRLGRQVLEELRPFCIRPVDELPRGEAYTVFCLNVPTSDPAVPPPSAEKWLDANRPQVAALLTQEKYPKRLSDLEINETTFPHYSYYEYDLAVPDWDAALLIDRPENFDELIHVMELANVQLAELAAYDRTLDVSLERSYRDLAAQKWRMGAGVLRSLREVRLDITRLSDELGNITKFFGDWHLARIYRGLSKRFHLADWQKTIDEKLNALHELYQILRQDQTNRWMMILEVTIVLLFIIDLVVLIIDIF